MKRLFSGVFALLLAINILCGCQQVLPEQTVICGDLTITLPGNFLDLSQEDYAEEFEMVFGFKDEAVCVIKEPVADLIPYFPEIDALEYARLAVESYGLDSAVEVVDEIPTFTYAKQTGELDFTYLVGIFQTETDFWMVQCYCDSENFDRNQSRMWEWITSVSFS